MAPATRTPGASAEDAVAREAVAGTPATFDGPPARPRGSAVGAVARAVVHTLWPVALVLLAWELWVRLGEVPPAVAPDPADVLAFIRDDPGSLLTDALDTVYVVAGGLVLGTVAGALLAGLAWSSAVARALISGPALITQCLPVATIAPVLARVLGYQTSTIVVIAALIAFFPVLVFTSAGLQQTPPGADDVFAVFGAGRWQRFWRLAVPAAIPRLLVALRLSVVAAVVGSMLAQWVMGTSGLGYRLVIAQTSFRTAEAWAASFVAIVLSVFLYSLVAVFCRIAASRFE